MCLSWFLDKLPNCACSNATQSTDNSTVQSVTNLLVALIPFASNPSVNWSFQFHSFRSHRHTADITSPFSAYYHKTSMTSQWLCRFGISLLYNNEMQYSSCHVTCVWLRKKIWFTKKIITRFNRPFDSLSTSIQNVQCHNCYYVEHNVNQNTANGKTRRFGWMIGRVRHW